MQAMRNPQNSKLDVLEAGLARHSLINFHSQLDFYFILHDKDTFLLKWQNLYCHAKADVCKQINNLRPAV